MIIILLCGCSRPDRGNYIGGLWRVLQSRYPERRAESPIAGHAPVRELEFSYQTRNSAAINHALASLVSGTDNTMRANRQSRITPRESHATRQTSEDHHGPAGPCHFG